MALSFASLGVVCLVAYFALKLLAGRGVGKGLGRGAVRVLARCPLEPRRSVYLIETAGRCFLIGVGEGPMSLLAEVDGTKVEVPAPSPPIKNFRDILDRVLNRSPGAGP